MSIYMCICRGPSMSKLDHGTRSMKLKCCWLSTFLPFIVHEFKGLKTDADLTKTCHKLLEEIATLVLDLWHYCRLAPHGMGLGPLGLAEASCTARSCLGPHGSGLL